MSHEKSFAPYALDTAEEENSKPQAGINIYNASTLRMAVDVSGGSIQRSEAHLRHHNKLFNLPCGYSKHKYHSASPYSFIFLSRCRLRLAIISTRQGFVSGRFRELGSPKPTDILFIYHQWLFLQIHTVLMLKYNRNTPVQVSF